jgi:hypothetical protein
MHKRARRDERGEQKRLKDCRKNLKPSDQESVGVKMKWKKDKNFPNETWKWSHEKAIKEISENYASHIDINYATKS